MGWVGASLTAVGLYFVPGQPHSQFQSVATAAVAVEQASSLHVTGRCVDRQNQPIADAEVRLYRFNDPSSDAVLLKTVNTNDKGMFDLGQWPDLQTDPSESGPRYLGIARKDGHASMPFSLRADVDEKVEVRVTMSPAATLTGQVRDQGGRPIANAKVIAFAEDVTGVRSGMTDADGDFEINDMMPIKAEYIQEKTGRRPLARFPVKVVHPDYGTKLVWYWETPGHLDIRFDQPTIVEGKVVGIDGRPATSICVCLQSANKPNHDAPPLGLFATTDKTGMYRFALQTNELVNLFVMNDRYTAQAIDSFKLVSNDTATAPDIQLTEGGFVVGRVLDDKTGQTVRVDTGDRIFVNVHSTARPLSGAAVETCVVQPDGTYHLRVPAGFCRVYLGGMVSRRNLSLDADPSRAPTPTTPREILIEDGKETSLDFKVRLRRN